MTNVIPKKTGIPSSSNKHPSSSEEKNTEPLPKKQKTNHLPIQSHEKKNSTTFQPTPIHKLHDTQSLELITTTVTVNNNKTAVRNHNSARSVQISQTNKISIEEDDDDTEIDVAPFETKEATTEEEQDSPQNVKYILSTFFFGLIFTHHRLTNSQKPIVEVNPVPVAAYHPEKKEKTVKTVKMPFEPDNLLFDNSTKKWIPKWQIISEVLMTKISSTQQFQVSFSLDPIYL